MVFTFGGAENVQTIIIGNQISGNGDFGIDASANKMIIIGNNLEGNTSGAINLTGVGNEVAHNKNGVAEDDARWRDRYYYLNLGDGDILAHSSTTWTKLNGVSTKRTTDAGGSWADSATDHASCKYGKVCAADKTKAIAFIQSSATLAYSTDSGNNWSAAAVNPNATDHPLCLSFPTTGTAVIGTKDGGGVRTIYYSTDGGNNWTLCTTGPTDAVYAISMFDSSNGFAIVDVGGPIWKTTDGGVNWTDTTHTMTSPFVGTFVQSDILAISATEFVGVATTSLSIYYYDGSGNATVKIAFFVGGDNAAQFPFNPIKLTNGKFYYGMLRNQTGATGGERDFRLVKTSSKDASSALYQSYPEFTRMFSGNGKVLTQLNSTLLLEYDTNKILVNLGAGYLLLDES